jgi:hypothetical protein
VGSLLANLEQRTGWWGGAVRRMMSSFGRRTVSVERTGHVAVGTQHFDPDHSDLGISPTALRLAMAQDLQHVVEARRRNFFLMLGRTRERLPPLFSSLPPGVCPLFFPLKLHRPERVERFLASHRVETVPFWRTGHPACDVAEFPEVRELRQSVLEIPIHQDLGPEACDALADLVLAAVREGEP